MMKRREFLATSAVASAAAALGLPAYAQAKPKVAFLLVGPKNDGGWSQHHYESAMKAQEHFGDAVEIIVQESVPEGPDAERVMTQLALDGANLIFTTSFGYMDATINVAGKFPDVKFEHATGYKTAPNVSVYNARFYEGRAVMATIAGRMTKTNKIGYIASFPIPEVIQGINSTFIHARKVNPAAEIRVVWINTWFDPQKEADATTALLGEGCDFVCAHTDSTAPLATLQTAGAYGFGQAADMAEYGPKPRLSSIIDNWSPYYVDRVQAIIDGTWASVNTWYGIKEGMVGIGEISAEVPVEVKAEAEKMRDDIAAGTYHPFTGALKKQDGSEWLAEGQVADDGTIAGMNFYVEGITSEYPA